MRGLLGSPSPPASSQLLLTPSPTPKIQGCGQRRSPHARSFLWIHNLAVCQHEQACWRTRQGAENFPPSAFEALLLPLLDWQRCEMPYVCRYAHPALWWPCACTDLQQPRPVLRTPNIGILRCIPVICILYAQSLSYEYKQALRRAHCSAQPHKAETVPA